MSVGAFLALGVAHFYAVRKAGLRQADLLSTRALLALGPILVIGMVAVFNHVGNPDRVFNMFSNLGTSWLAREVAACGITVNSVAPGLIATDIRGGLESPERQKEMSRDIPVQRLGTPEEVAATVAFLASEEAAYITGEEIDINGGSHMD